MSPTRPRSRRGEADAVANKIGYPDSGATTPRSKIVRGDALGNSQRANEFEFAAPARQDRQAGGQDRVADDAADRQRVLQPAREQHQLPGRHPAAALLQQGGGRRGQLRGGGAVVGHELTHGFDDQGRQFDAEGNLRDWWTPADGKAFEERAACIANQYSGYTAVADVKLNGKLTLGENVADNGGLRLGWMALMDSVATRPLGPADGFSPEQRVLHRLGAVVV